MLHKMKWGGVLLLALVMMCCLTGCTRTSGKNNESWPKTAGIFPELAKQSVDTYHQQNRDYKQFLSVDPYDPFGDFLNWGREKNYDNAPKDSNGIVTSVDDPNRYNPVTIAQYSLTLYGQYINGKVDKEAFLHQTDYLLSMMEADGSVRYYFDHPYYCLPQYFRSGWTSAMASGHVLSCCTRAYHLTGSDKYIEAAKKSLDFLMVPISENGVLTTLVDLDPSLTGYIIFEEYPTKPATYTLNGFMYTLIGIYEWSCIESPTQEQASEMFKKGILTLSKILPYYDIGGFTCYDLSHMTVPERKGELPHIGVGYHVEHTAFCKIFYDITGIDTFLKYYNTWASYVDE